MKFFPNSVSLGSSATAEAPEQVGAAKMPLRKVPRFPGSGFQARFPGTGSQTRVRVKRFQSKVPRNRFPSFRNKFKQGFPGKGFQERVSANVSNQGFKERVSKQDFQERVFPNKTRF